MKKLLLTGILFCSAFVAQAQFYQGFGIMAGGTLGRQNWYFHEPESKEKMKYLLRYNAEVFAEFGNHPTFRWVTEIQYNVKGSKVHVTNPAWNSTDATYQNQYLAWNNYLMIRKEFFSIIPYFKIGPRAEYVFSSPQQFSKFHITGAAGAGIEFVAFGPVKFITEAWWVPDATKSFDTNSLTIKQHCWELRVGIKFGHRNSNTCPAYREQDQGQN